MVEKVDDEDMPAVKEGPQVKLGPLSPQKSESDKCKCIEKSARSTFGFRGHWATSPFRLGALRREHGDPVSIQVKRRRNPPISRKQTL